MKKVVVTGATGRTGRLVLQKLRNLPSEFEVIGFARSVEKAQEQWGTTDGWVFGDIRDPESLKKAIANSQALVILTSAVPEMKTGPTPEAKPVFGFKPGEMPEQIDWLGQKNQIYLAHQAGVEHIVLVGSMGGTMPNHPLNSLGEGKILVWKRRAEEYLINSGIDYTIIRAGGLLDQPGGVRELMVGDNDSFLTNPPPGVTTTVPRADVAEVVVRALREPQARNKAFDLISKPVGQENSVITEDFAQLFAQTSAL